MSEVKITGATILIDEADLSIVAGRKVCLVSDGYPGIRQDQSRTRLARVIVEAQPGQQVDHINGNKLDNRRQNLRICTNRENCQNRQGPNKNSTSGYRGVTQDRKWRAQIMVDGRRVFLGRFETKKLAAKAFDKAALKYYGEYAGKLNFPQN